MSATGFKADLTNCDREPIHVLGNIQPFGFLVSAGMDWIVRQASANMAAFLNVEAEKLLGAPLLRYAARRLSGLQGSLRPRRKSMTIRQAVLALFAIAGLAGSSALAAPMPISAAASIAEMQGLNGAAAPVVQVLSYYPGLNRGGGLFVWNAASGDAPDSCTVFAPQKQAAGQKGRWIRQLSGALDATMCGAYWDNSHDDAAALTRAFAAASN